MSPVKLGAYLILGVVGLLIAIKIITGIVSGVLAIVFPLAILGGVGLILYGLVSGRSLGGGRRYLP